MTRSLRQLRTLGAAALLAFAALNTQAQSVQEILNLGPGTQANDVLVNPFPADPWQDGLFLTTYTPDFSYSVLAVDLTQPPNIAGVVDSFPMLNRKLGFDPLSGDLFEVGGTLLGGNTAWRIRRSQDHGVTWEFLGTDWQWVAGKSASALGVATDDAGILFACGRAADSRGLYHPVIRRSVSDGASWQDTVLSSKGGNFDTAADIQFVPTNAQNVGGIFVVGRVGNNWTVWRSRDGGVNWVVVHSWVPSKGIAEATAIASDLSGNLYVGGMGNRVNYPRNWYVWSSADGGDTWQDLGCPLLSGTDCIVNDLEVDPTGDSLLVVGTVSQFNWKMQQWSSVGGWSQAIRPYGNYGNSGPASKALGVANNGTTGLFYVTGWANDTSGQPHAKVLKVSNSSLP